MPYGYHGFFAANFDTPSDNFPNMIEPKYAAFLFATV